MGIRKECVMYCLKAGGREKSVERRQVEMLDSVISWGGVVEERIVELWADRRNILEAIRKRKANGRSFVLVVSGWHDIAHPDVAKALVEGWIPVVISEKAGKIGGRVNEDGWLVGGSVVDHALDVNRLLKAYLDGVSGKKKGEEPSEDGVNDIRQKEAYEFAITVWPDIKKTALMLRTINQSEIAKAMHDAGQRSKKGRDFTQPILSRIIRQAQKSQEWVDLCFRIENDISKASPGEE